MKLLVTGDWHYRSQNPVARLDNFQEALDAKIREVGEIAKREGVEAILQPGDVFDSPSPAYSTLTALERILRDINIPIWAVPGNHDEHAHSLESLDRTAFGHLSETGLVRDLSAHPVDMGTCLVTGTGFSATTDNDVSDYLRKPLQWVAPGSMDIHVAHGMLLEREPGFELKHTLLEDVAKHPDCPDVLIVGHEHLGFGVKRLPRAMGGELVAINPGALVRLSAHPGEIERMPQVCLLEVYPGMVPECQSCGKPLDRVQTLDLPEGQHLAHCKHCGKDTVVDDSEYGDPELWGLGSPVIETTLIPLESARPGHEVLSRDHLEAAAEREAKMGRFLGLLSGEGEAKYLDIQSMVEGIARSENLPREVVDEALRRIAAAREAIGGRAS